MILRRAFYREVGSNTLSITVLLLAVLALAGLTTLLGRAARGDLAKDIVLALLGWQMLKRLDLLLPLAWYLGLLLTMNRWYRDSEMTVLMACGVGLWQWLRPVIVLSSLVAVLVGLGAFYLTPLASRQMEQLRVQSAARFEVERLEPGVFNPLPGGNRAFYAAHIDIGDGRLEEVFIGSLEQGRKGVVVAQNGQPYTDPATGARFLLLQSGSLYDGAPGQPGYRVVDFGSYLLRLEPPPPPTLPRRSEELASGALLSEESREALAEWHWRLAKPAITLVLALFALALAHTDARRGRLGNLFVAILVYFIYSNLLALAQILVKKGAVPAALGMWWVHAAMLLVALYLLARRARHRPLMPFASLRP